MLADYEPRRPIVAGCRFHEAMVAVGIEGGVSGNVVPDEVTVLVAHRFAPDRSEAQAEAHLRERVGEFLEDGDEVEIVDRAPPAPPSTEHPVIADMIRRHSLEVRAKLGWTDVARFASRGIPAANFGPGDPTVAHTPEECLSASSLWRCWTVIDDLAGGP